MRTLVSLQKQINKEMQKIVEKAVRKKILPMIKEIILSRTRGEGKGVNREGGNRTKLAELEESTIRKRSRLQLHSETSPSRSNLTETGKLLDSMSLSFDGKNITVSFKGSRKRGNKTVRNQDIAEYVSVKRPFANLGKVELKKLAVELERLIQLELSKL